MKKISFKGAMWDSIFLTGAKMLTMVFGIVLSKILSTGLSLTEYGAYSAVNIVTSVVTSLILLGFGDAVNYYFNKKEENTTEQQRLRVVSTVFLLEFIVGVIAALVIIFGRDLIGSFFNNDALGVLLIVASVLPVLTNLMYFYQVLFISVGRAKQMSLYNLAMMVFKIISALVSVYVVKDIISIYLVLVLLELMQILVFKFTLAKQGTKVNITRVAPGHIKTILAYSLPMGVYALTGTLLRDVDKLVVGRMSDPDSLAVYNNCSKLLPFDFLVVSFATVLIPYIVRYVTEGNKEQTGKLFSTYMKIGYYSVWILGAAVLTVPVTMISFLYDNEYTVGLPIFILYIVDSMLRFASMHLILTAAGKTKTLMYYSFITLGLNLGLNILFYYLFGMIGPAVATLIATLIYTVMILNKSVKTVGLRYRDIFDARDILFLLLTIAVFGVGGFWLNISLVNIGIDKYVSMMITVLAFIGAQLLIHGKRIIGIMKTINSFKM